MKIESNRFAERSRDALQNPELQRALDSATGRLREQREAAFAEFGEGERLRERGRAIKHWTLARLDRYLDELASQVEARGGVVHWAADAREACEIVVGIVEERGGRRVVKGKSMTSEEIGLNDALEARGIECVETDLGEYVIQLAGEAPSHIIVPAIHKTLPEVTRLFRDEQIPLDGTDHRALAGAARKHLRKKFLAADVGITGVNFAVAATGSIAVVENEGNGRLSTSLPECHIALMGMEKVIPDLSSLAVFLRILARSATGQKMSSYVSLLSGPRRSHEEDGPEAFHLVILDNGRSRLLADPALREALHCIRCGACLNVCPVYRRSGGHAYGWVYPGPIGAAINPSLVGPEHAGTLPFASSLCGACRVACPVKIDIPALLLRQRAEVASRLGTVRSKWSMRVFRWVMANPGLYAALTRSVHWLARPWARDGWLKSAPGLEGWTRHRDLPLPDRRSFHTRWRERGAHGSGEWESHE